MPTSATRNNPVRAGLLGLGGWGARVAEAAKVTPEIRVSHGYARNPETRQAFCQKYGYVAASSYEEMLENPDIDAVLLITPNLGHYQQMLQAVEHGKHIFIDKPLTATLEEGAAAVKAVEKAGLVLGVDHEARYDRGVRRLKQAIEAGALGRLNLADSNLSSPTGLRTKVEEWRANRAEVPGGALIQIGIHHIDNLQYLLGPIVRVQGWQRHRLIPAPIDDTTVTLLEFEDGMLGYHGSGYASSFSGWIRVYGEAASGVYDRFEGLRLTGNPANGTAEGWREPADSYADPMPMIAHALKDFAEAVRTGGKAEVGGREALSALAVVLGAVESNETGRAVDVRERLRAAGAGW